MADNDSHYNQTVNTSGSGNTSDNGIEELNIRAPWAPNIDQEASDRRRPFPPTNPPMRPPGAGVQPPFPLPPAPPFGNNPGSGNWTGPSTLPSFPAQLYGQVRFLNASTNTFDVDILVDGNPFVMNSRFGNYTQYDWIPDGFHTVTVRRSTSIRTVLYQQNLPFTANQKVTMVLVDSAMGGLEMVRVIDTGCSNLPQTTGCYRFANMTFAGSAYDLRLSNGETIFRNVSYQSVTPYKHAIAGTYQFNVTNAHFQLTMRELPIIIIGSGGTGTGFRETILSYKVSIQARKNYTTYIIGNNWSDQSLRAITLED